MPQDFISSIFPPAEVKIVKQAFTDWKEMEALAPDKEYYYSAMYEYIEKQFGALRIDIKENLWNQAVEEVKAEALSDEDLRLKRFYKAEFEEKKHTQILMCQNHEEGRTHQGTASRPH